MSIPNVPGSNDPAAEAFKKWWEANRTLPNHCFTTNVRFFLPASETYGFQQWLRDNCALPASPFDSRPLPRDQQHSYAVVETPHQRTDANESSSTPTDIEPSDVVPKTPSPLPSPAGTIELETQFQSQQAPQVASPRQEDAHSPLQTVAMEIDSVVIPETPPNTDTFEEQIPPQQQKTIPAQTSANAPSPIIAEQQRRAPSPEEETADILISLADSRAQNISSSSSDVALEPVVIEQRPLTPEDRAIIASLIDLQKRASPSTDVIQEASSSSLQAEEMIGDDDTTITGLSEEEREDVLSTTSNQERPIQPKKKRKAAEKLENDQVKRLMTEKERFDHLRLRLFVYLNPLIQAFPQSNPIDLGGVNRLLNQFPCTEESSDYFKQFHYTASAAYFYLINDSDRFQECRDNIELLSIKARTSDAAIIKIHNVIQSPKEGKEFLQELFIYLKAIEKHISSNVSRVNKKKIQPFKNWPMKTWWCSLSSSLKQGIKDPNFQCGKIKEQLIDQVVDLSEDLKGAENLKLPFQKGRFFGQLGFAILLNDKEMGLSAIRALQPLLPKETPSRFLEGDPQALLAAFFANKEQSITQIISKLRHLKNHFHDKICANRKNLSAK